MFRSLNYLFILLVTIPTAPHAFAQPSAGPPPANVRVDLVRKQNVSQHRIVTGQIEPARRSQLAAEQSGLVVQAPPEPGVAVKAGQIIARLDDQNQKIALQVAEAVEDRLQAVVVERTEERNLTRVQKGRLQKLFDTNAAYAKELEDTTLRLQVDEAQLLAAMAEARESQALGEQAKVDLNKTKTIAPFDGYIVSKQTEVGQWLAPGTAVAEIVEVSKVKVRLQVPQEVLPAIDASAEISVYIEALDRHVKAPIFSIIPDGDPRSRTFSVLLKLANESETIRPGMSVSAEVPTGETVNALTVPRDAVRSTPTGTIVIVNRNGVAAFVPVQVRFGAGDRFVIDGALKEGDEVLTEGNERIRPGQPLVILSN